MISALEGVLRSYKEMRVGMKMEEKKTGKVRVRTEKMKGERGLGNTILH